MADTNGAGAEFMMVDEEVSGAAATETATAFDIHHNEHGFRVNPAADVESAETEAVTGAARSGSSLCQQRLAPAAGRVLQYGGRLVSGAGAAAAAAASPAAAANTPALAFTVATLQAALPLRAAAQADANAGGFRSGLHYDSKRDPLLLLRRGGSGTSGGVGGAASVKAALMPSSSEPCAASPFSAAHVVATAPAARSLACPSPSASSCSSHHRHHHLAHYDSSSGGPTTGAAIGATQQQAIAATYMEDEHASPFQAPWACPLPSPQDHRRAGALKTGHSHGHDGRADCSSLGSTGGMPRPYPPSSCPPQAPPAAGATASVLNGSSSSWCAGATVASCRIVPPAACYEDMLAPFLSAPGGYCIMDTDGNTTTAASAAAAAAATAAATAAPPCATPVRQTAPAVPAAPAALLPSQQQLALPLPQLQPLREDDFNDDLIRMLLEDERRQNETLVASLAAISTATASIAAPTAATAYTAPPAANSPAAAAAPPTAPQPPQPQPQNGAQYFYSVGGAAAATAAAAAPASAALASAVSTAATTASLSADGSSGQLGSGYGGTSVGSCGGSPRGHAGVATGEAALRSCGSSCPRSAFATATAIASATAVPDYATAWWMQPQQPSAVAAGRNGCPCFTCGGAAGDTSATASHQQPQMPLQSQSQPHQMSAVETASAVHTRASPGAVPPPWQQPQAAATASAAAATASAAAATASAAAAGSLPYFAVCDPQCLPYLHAQQQQQQQQHWGTASGVDGSSRMAAPPTAQAAQYEMLATAMKWQ